MSKTRSSKRKVAETDDIIETDMEVASSPNAKREKNILANFDAKDTDFGENQNATERSISEMIKQLVDRMECDPEVAGRCERMVTFNDTLRKFIGVVGNGVSPYAIIKEDNALTGHIFNNGSYQVAVIGQDHDGINTLSATSFVIPVMVLTSTDLVGERIVTDKIQGPLYRLGVGVKVGMTHDDMSSLLNVVCRDIGWKKAYMDDFDFRKPFNSDAYMVMRRTYFPGKGRVADEGLPTYRKGDVPYIPIFDNTRRAFDLMELDKNDTMARVEPGDVGFIGVTIGLGKEGIRFLPNWISVFKRGSGQLFMRKSFIAQEGYFGALSIR
ncbi:hypothetical protein BC829DRAFT_441316 [Chytridium lagenaria]|nr:hypothetical protein BC829DRAFT_441316 [Chytridium lagenaria]